MDTKYCSQCESQQPLTNFHRRLNGLAAVCKVCMPEYKRILREEKKELNKKYDRDHWNIDITEENIQSMKELLEGLGYDVNKDIHKQFLERHPSLIK